MSHDISSAAQPCMYPDAFIIPTSDLASWYALTTKSYLILRSPSKLRFLHLIFSSVPTSGVSALGMSFRTWLEQHILHLVCVAWIYFARCLAGPYWLPKVMCHVCLICEKANKNRQYRSPLDRRCFLLETLDILCIYLVTFLDLPCACVVHAW